MNKALIKKLTRSIQNLNNARRIRDHGEIAKRYERITSVVGELYTTNSVTTTLAVENALISGEQNGIPKTSNTHKTIGQYLSRIAKAQEADAEQKRNPEKYHAGALLDHADKHCKNGSAFDTVRVALAKCRSHAKNQITAVGADEIESKRECYILRHSGLADAERKYIERQIGYQEHYDSVKMKKEAQEDGLHSFDAKIRREQRELRMSPAPETE